MTEKRQFPSGIEVCKQIRAEYGPRTILSFSRGKDSLGAYLQLRRVFDDIILIHFFICPGLSFVDESLAYYSKAFGQKIYNLPSPHFYDKLNAYTFQSPAHAAVIRAAKLPRFTARDIQLIIAKEEGVEPENVMAATGVRAADSPRRRLAMEVHGPVSLTNHVYHPTYDWTAAKLREEIVKSKIALPVDYEMFGRSLDGLDLRFVWPIRERFPEDYRRLCEWFPLLPAEVARYEFNRQ